MEPYVCDIRTKDNLFSCEVIQPDLERYVIFADRVKNKILYINLNSKMNKEISIDDEILQLKFSETVRQKLQEFMK